LGVALPEGIVVACIDDGVEVPVIEPYVCVGAGVLTVRGDRDRSGQERARTLATVTGAVDIVAVYGAVVEAVPVTR